SAVINNNTDETMRVSSSLAASGVKVSGTLVDGRTIAGAPAPVEVKANGEARVDWLLAVSDAGPAKLQVEARGDKFADAMEKSFTVYDHGIEKFISRSGKLRSDNVT